MIEQTRKTCPWKMVTPEGKLFVPPDNPLRSDIPEPPSTMKHLPIDERGYPIPFFVAWVDMKPEFRAASTDAYTLCIKHKLCWVCGTPLNSEAVFVIGPMCSINRISSEPPSHIACARYSAMACPFLVKPQMVRRAFDDPRKEPPAGIGIARNPGVMLLWFARFWEVIRVPATAHTAPGRLWHLTSNPKGVEWYCRGRKATRQEILDAIASGLPALEAASDLDGSRDQLEGFTQRAMRLVPKS